MIDLLATGGRRIFLLLPFRHGRKMIKSITLKPVTWSHTLKWQAGEYERSLDLLHDIAKESTVILGKLRYPDVDRVMEQFFAMLPHEIKDAIASGSIPRKVSVESFVDEPVVEASTEPVEIDQEFGEPIEEQPFVPQAVEPSPDPVFTPPAQTQDNSLGFEGIH